MLENPITKEEFQKRVKLNYFIFRNIFPPDIIYTNLTVENKITIRINKKVQDSEIICRLFNTENIVNNKYHEEKNCKCLIINTLDYIEIKYLLQKKSKFKLQLMERIGSSNICQILAEYFIESTHDLEDDKFEFLPEDYGNDIKSPNKILSRLKRNGYEYWSKV